MESKLVLKQVLEKTLSGHDLTYEETKFIKKTYRALREDYAVVLADIAEDELAVMALQHALSSLEAHKLSGPEFLHEVMYSVQSLKGKRKKDRMLRSEIAYRMALAAFAYQHIRAYRKLEVTVVASEFLHQISALDDSLQKYRKYKALQNRPANEPGLCA